MLVKVKYQIGQYFGTEYVNASEEDDNETIIAKAKRKLKPFITMPMYSEHFEVVTDDR